MELIGFDMKRHVLTICALALAATSMADWNWHLESNYDYSIDPSWGDVTVTNIIATMGGGSADGSYGWGSTSWAFTSANPHITMSFDTNWFNPMAAEPTLIGSFAIGVVQDLPNDAPGQKHAVLFMDSTAASRTPDIAWGNFFTHTDEDSLIFAIEQATTHSGDEAQPYWDEVNGFFQGDSQHGQLGPNGTEGSAWFGPNQSLSIVAWSDGQVIGGGTSSVSTVQQPVPEPATLSILAGSGLAALLRKRRK